MSVASHATTRLPWSLTDMPMKFASTGRTITISDDCLDALYARRQIGARVAERGGQLFARVESGDMEIVTATDVEGSRKRFSFRPSRRAEQQQIDSLFGAGLHYVGDWHTHPEDIPTPSELDADKIGDLFTKSSHQLNWLVLVIVGRVPFPEGIYVGFADQTGISKAQPVDTPAGGNCVR